jgi:hypothetical protein
MPALSAVVNQPKVGIEKHPEAGVDNTKGRNWKTEVPRVFRIILLTMGASMPKKVLKTMRVIIVTFLHRKKILEPTHDAVPTCRQFRSPA